MSEHREHSCNPPRPDGASESMRLLAIDDIANQIAVLVVRQHRRLKTPDSKKSGENPL